MKSKSNRREELRPHGIVSQSCRDCYFLEGCGGFQGKRSLSNCFEESCCVFNNGDASTCDTVCPNNPTFSRWLSETKGLGFGVVPEALQSRATIPSYVP